MASSLSLFQANRSRDLGATVYCVGVKDFNETQVNEALVHVEHRHMPLNHFLKTSQGLFLSF